MRESTRDKREGKLRELKGSVKKGAGELTGSPSLKVEGQIEKSIGKLQQKRGRVKPALGK